MVDIASRKVLQTQGKINADNANADNALVRSDYVTSRTEPFHDTHLQELRLRNYSPDISKFYVECVSLLGHATSSARRKSLFADQRRKGISITSGGIVNQIQSPYNRLRFIPAGFAGVRCRTSCSMAASSLRRRNPAKRTLYVRPTAVSRRATVPLSQQEGEIMRLSLPLTFLILLMCFPITNKQQAQTSQETVLGTCDGSAESVAFSPDGRSVAVGCGDYERKASGRNLRIWELQTGQVRTLGRGDAGIYSVSYSPDGKIIASGNVDGVVRIWNVRSGSSRILGSFGNRTYVDKDGRQWTTSGSLEAVLAFSHTAQILVFGSNDKVVRLWNGLTNNLRSLGTCDSAVTSVAFSPKGTHVAAGCGQIRVWDVRTSRMRGFGDSDYGSISVALSPDGNKLASATWRRTNAGTERAVTIWNLKTGQMRNLGSYGGRSGGWTPSITFSPDGNSLAAGGGDNTIHIWDLQSGQMQRMGRFRDRIESVAFSPDGKRIAAGSNDGTVVVFNMK